MAIVNTQIIENINITDNGTYDVARYTEANVNVVPKYCIQKTKDANNKIEMGSSVIDLTGANDLGDCALCYSYYLNPNVSGICDLSSISNMSGKYACYWAFAAKEPSNEWEWESTPYSIESHITSVDLSGLTTISGEKACDHMFYNCKNLTTVDLSNLTSVSGKSSCDSMFEECTKLTGKIDLSKLTALTSENNNSLRRIFYNCSKITDVDLSGLTTIGTPTPIYNDMGELIGGYKLSYAFYGCSDLKTVDLSKLTTVQYGNGHFSYAFYNCTKLISVNLSRLTSILGSSQFTYAFRGTNLSSLSFDSLSDLGSSGYALQNMLAYCNNRMDIYFPALTTNSFHGLTNHFQNFVYYVGNKTIHFPSNLSEIVATFDGYPNFGGMGSPGITLLFDLPATE